MTQDGPTTNQSSSLPSSLTSVTATANSDVQSESEKSFKVGLQLQAKRDRLVHFLRRLAVCWPVAQSA